MAYRIRKSGTPEIAAVVSLTNPQTVQTNPHLFAVNPISRPDLAVNPTSRAGLPFVRLLTTLSAIYHRPGIRSPPDAMAVLGEPHGGKFQSHRRPHV